jgi:hypothetical protein
MNRSLMIPAGCCLCAFAGLMVAFHAAAGRESASQRQILATASLSGDRRATTPPAADTMAANSLVTADEAEQLLTALADEYIRPWRKWQNSPHRLYSRAAPRPIPTITTEVAMSAVSTDESSFLLASIQVQRGKQSQQVPCVIDRKTKEVRLFADSQWLGAQDWLKQAPLP